MNKYLKPAVLLLAVSLLLVSCGMGLNSLKYDKQTNLFTDDSTGVSYTDAPSCYEAAVRGEEYAKWRSAGENVIFYRLGEADPLKWLTEEGKTIFYAEGAELPELDKLGVNEVLICTEELHAISLAKITDSGDIAGLISTWLTAEAVEYPASGIEKDYRIKFASPDYPWLYYNLIYVDCGSNGCYLYSRDSGRCVRTDSTVQNYLDGTAGG